MQRPTPTPRRIAAVAVAAALALTGCSDDGDDDAAAADPAVAESTTDEATDEATDEEATDEEAGEEATDEEDGAEGEGSTEAALLIDGVRYEGMLECVITSLPEGETLEVLGEGSAATGDGYAQLRLVDSPPSIGDASVRITVADRGEYRQDFEASGELTGEVDDLFWEVDDRDVIVLLGTFPVDDGELTIDVEAPCERIG